MKGILFKFISVAAACVLMFQLVGVSIAGATELESEDINSNYNQVISDYNEFTLDTTGSDLVETQSVLGTVAIWVISATAAYAIGVVVDGVVSYYSGKSPSEWVKYGIGNLEKKIKDFAKKYNIGTVYVNNSTGAVTWSSCTKYPCPMPVSLPELKNE